MQIVIHGKSKIRFAAAEINDPYCPVCRQFIDHILDEFQITIDLAELIESRLRHTAVRRLHTQSHQEIQDIMLGAVMRKCLQILLFGIGTFLRL